MLKNALKMGYTKKIPKKIENIADTNTIIKVSPIDGIITDDI